MSIPSSPLEIIWRLSLRSAPDVVYRALATDAGRERFWAESSRQTGPSIALGFVNGVRTTAHVVEARRPDLLRLRYFDSLVTFELAPDERGGTILLLRNTGVEAALYPEVLAGWLNVLFPLKAYIDFGVDLRCHDPAKTWDKGFADQ